MDITRLDPTAVSPASSSAASTVAAKSSNLSFAEVLKSQTRQAEVGGAAAIAALLNRGAAAISPTASPTASLATSATTSPASASGAITVNALAPTEGTVADAASMLREWGGASRSKKAKNGESPLALSAHDSSLAGRYDVLAKRDDNEQRGARHSQRA